MYILEEYLYYRRVPEFFLYYLWNQSIQYLQMLDNSPIPQSFTTTDPLSENSLQILLLIAQCSYSGVSHSAEVQTQFPVAEVTNYSSLPSHLQTV